MNHISIRAFLVSCLLTSVASPIAGQCQLAKLLPEDGEAFDEFSQSVAISGDIAIVGSQFDDDNGLNSGSAYLFDVSTGEQITKLLPQDGATLDEFGSSVAIDGDTAIVGARFNDDNGDGSGSAYLFDVESGQQIAKLLPLDGADSDFFGRSVAISGDIAVVGAIYDDDNGSRSGSAYLFDVDSGKQIAKLLPQDGASSDYFGHSVAISGHTVIVGAYRDDDNGLTSGSAYLFDVESGQQIAKLLPHDGAAGDQFGRSVSVSGNTAIVGATRDEDNGGNSGSAYLFDVGSGQQIAKLLPQDGASSDFFGDSVAMSSDTAIVSASGDDDNGGSSGSAYLFDIESGKQIAKLVAQDGTILDSFGTSVAMSGDTAVVGAHGDDDNGIGSGSAYVFTRAGCVPSHAAILSVTAGFGSILSGGIPDLLATDDAYVRVRSAFGFLSSEPNVLDLRIEAVTDIDIPESMNITVESKLNNPNGNVRLRLRDWDTGSLATVHQYESGTTDETENVSINDNASRFVRESDGRIELSIKPVVVATFSLSGFIASYDYVVISVN